MATPIPKNRAAFTTAEAVTATRGTLVGPVGLQETVIGSPMMGVVSDNRAIVPGGIFVALRGETHDGHAFAAGAARRGAGAIVIERGRRDEVVGVDDKATLGVTVVEVDDTLVAWGDLARFHLERWRTKATDPAVIAITGSAGKTTTKELLAALCAVIAPTHFTAGNLNNRVGVPSVVFALEEIHRFCVLEMGMSLPGELDAITGFARPDVSIVTNIGVAHAEGVGGKEGVMREKGAVYRALTADGVAVVNADDDYALRAAKDCKGKRVTFGRGPSDYRLVDRTPLGVLGSRVTIDARGRTLVITLPLPGEAAAIDLAAALAAQEAASGVLLDVAQIDRALAGVRLDGRATLKKLGSDVLLLDDSYNANPASMRSALATLNEIAGTRRKVAVLGEMKELGDLTDAEHLSLGDAIGEAKPDLVVGCGGKIDLALDRAAEHGIAVIKCPSTDAAALEIQARVKPGDAILVKGSRSVGAEKVVLKLAESLPSPRN